MPAQDADLFADAMSNVAPLPRDPRGRVRARPPLHVTNAAPLQPAIDEPEPGAAERGYAAAGVDRREVRRLKRGDYPPGRRLDLHGQTATEAASSVSQFLQGARARHRCVAIIHGRGLHSNGNVAVLKQRVRTFLRQHPAVLAFADAPPDDGGDGVVYVLLRG